MICFSIDKFICLNNLNFQYIRQCLCKFCFSHLGPSQKYKKFQENSLSPETKRKHQMVPIEITAGQNSNSKQIFYPKKLDLKCLVASKRISAEPQKQANTDCETPFRGLTYDQIKPQRQQKNVFEKFKSFCSNLFPNLVCGCEQTSKATIFMHSCDRGVKWFQSAFQNQDYQALKEQFNIYKQKENSSKQLELDLDRSLPLLTSAEQKKNELREVLKAYSAYCPEIGYMQGMNMVAGSIVFHTDPWVAFYVLVHLFDTLQMRDIYMSDLPGFQKHVQIIDMLILKHVPDLYRHFVFDHINQCEEGIKVEMFCVPWLFSLFATMVPISFMGILLDNIFLEGWCYIYKLILTFLIYYQEQLVFEDMTGVMSLLGSQNYKVEVSNDVDWEELLLAAKNLRINSKFVSQLHTNYDREHQRFKL